MNHVIIIAEAGVNHNGDIELAKKLIDEAKNAGADYVKFQSFKAKTLVSKYAEKADYQKRSTGPNESQFEMIKKLELSEGEHVILVNHCLKRGIKFMSSPFDIDSIHYLASLNLDFFKVPSGEITNLPYLREMAKYNKKVILSTGMSSIEEIQEAIQVLLKYGTTKQNITILHCNTEYPTPMKDVNLLAMRNIERTFDINVGYSDHTEGIEIPIAATALGAKVIEKHFTLDKTMHGPDHKASLDPIELKSMVLAIRNIEQALGLGDKNPSESEIKNISIARKSIVAKYFIKSGEIFTEENIAIKRPGNGISPMKWDFVIGQTAPRDFVEDELIEI